MKSGGGSIPVQKEQQRYRQRQSGGYRDSKHQLLPKWLQSSMGSLVEPVPFEDDESPFYDEFRNKPTGPLVVPPKDYTKVPPERDVTGTGLYHTSSGSSIDIKRWDVFRLLPPRPDDRKRGFWLDLSLQLLKLITYPIVFALLLASAIACKATFLFMTSAIGRGGQNLTLCGQIPIPPINLYGRNATVIMEHRHVVKYVWAVYMALCAPEIFCFIRCLHRVFFRNIGKPSAGQFFLSFCMETLVAGGVGTLVFYILPRIDAISGAMFMSALCFMPALLGLLSRKASKLSVILIVLDLICIAGQSSGLWAWPTFVPYLGKHAWAYPLAAILCSLSWWENYVSKQSMLPCIRKLATIAEDLKTVRSKTYIIVAPWKCLIYFATLFVFMSFQMNVSELLEASPFNAKHITVIIQKPPGSIFSPPLNPPAHQLRNQFKPIDNNFGDGELLNPHTTEHLQKLNFWQDSPKNDPNDSQDSLLYRMKRDVHEIPKIVYTTPYDALWVFLVSVLLGFLCYQCAKFACKVTMQRLSFALPLSLTSPVLVAVLSTLCHQRQKDPCFFTEMLPYEVFWTCPPETVTVDGFFKSPHTWFWLVWFISQFWATIHVWFPKCERLADTDRLFVLPWYSGGFIDQSLMMNRQRVDNIKIKTEEIELEGDDGSGMYDTVSTDLSSMKSMSLSGQKSQTLSGSKSTDNITRIYACATMWHETHEEMLYMLKSIFRLDEDQCARRNAQKYLKIVDPDYYDFDAHIMFDDAFDINEYGEPVLNRFVRQLIEVIDVAAGAVHQITMRVKPPRKSSAPYGGRLEWILPGKNKLTVHLKDRNKIRVRKRWSQVMYMYYLLGHRLMEKEGDIKRKATIAENTYILTLDGDVDFEPDSVQLLVDLMKKNRRLGAACGRIHPRGSGPIVWYQKFEYAIGHWFQKATEHMIGCVLCSPGCFSLFRASALMDDNVLRRYATKAERPTDYIQYDQGEDRWLCTLLLQRGYRVEYSAASDALTFAPQSFSEFFNQRRRWVPSTIANIVDLLHDHKSVVKLNDSISGWYIAYQFAMLTSSVLGPGTIFLMVAGAVNISFSSSTTASFVFVLLPVLIFLVVCLLCRTSTQLILAQVISAWFAMLMMAVIVGTALQIKKDGLTSPHAMFLLFLVGSCIVAALLHPLEFTCVFPGIIYFLAIPCTYMLLSIYSVCNLNIVSWGTREVVKETELKKKGKNISILEQGANYHPGEIDGVYSIGCGNTCRMLCCMQPSIIGESPQMTKLLEKMDNVDKRLDRLDRRYGRRTQSGIGVVDAVEQQRIIDSQPLLEEDEEEVTDENFDLPYHHIQKEKAAQSDSWLNDRCLRQAERDHLEPEEEKFWIDLRGKFLYPIKEDKKRLQITSDLVALRNQIAFGFLMCNALFILVVFLLQLKKDCLNVEWPLGEKINRTMVPCNSENGEEESVEMGLQLEPIGFVFLFFFMSLLVIQFIAMLLHRFGTLSHIIASTELFCKRKTLDRLSEEELVAEHFVEIAKELQAIRGVDEDSGMNGQFDEPENVVVSRREIVKRLENSRKSQMSSVHRTETLDAAFRKRFFNLSDQNSQRSIPRRRSSRLTQRNDTIRAVQSRRDQIYGTLDGPPKEAEVETINNGRSDLEIGNGQPRGPSRRRVDQIFRNRETDGMGNGDIQKESDQESIDEDQFRQGPPGRIKDQAADGTGGIKRSAMMPLAVPLRKGASRRINDQRKELLKDGENNRADSVDSNGSAVTQVESHL